MREHTSPDSATRPFNAATLIAIGNIASRLLGLLRERVIAGYFGTSLEASAFVAAARVPTMIYDLLIGGMLSAALVPVLASYAATRRAELWRALSVLLSAAAVVTGFLALGVYAFAPQIAWLLGAGLPDGGVEMVEQSLRFIAPSILAFGVAGTITGALYALERFSLPAAAGVVYNAALIVTVVVLEPDLGIYAVSLGVTVGACAQVVLLAPGLRDGRLRPVLDLRHPVVRRVLVLYAPIGLGLLVAQFQVWVDTRLASQAGASALAVMRYGTHLIQFPHGFIAVAISLAILPTLSATFARDEPRTFARTLARGIRVVLALTLPAAVGLAVLAEPIVGAVFQHGAFDEVSRYSVVLALLLYLFGLPFAAIDWPLNYAFYARQNTLTPALVGVLAVGVYLAVAVSLGPTLNMLGFPPGLLFAGLVLADSAKHTTHAVVMLVLTRRVIGPAALEGAGHTAVAAGAGALVMGAVVWLLDGALAQILGDGTLAWATRAALGGLVGVAVYLPLAARLGVTEIGWLAGHVRTRFLGDG